METSDTVAAICFDLDSTLCVREQSDSEIHKAVFDRVGVEPFFSPADVRAVDPSVLPTAETGREYYENLYRAVVADKDAHPAPDVLAALAAATVEVVDPTAVSFRSGAQEALEYACERYEVGLITNGGEATQTAKLDRLGIVDVFDTAIFCDPANGIEPKPDPTPFEMTLADLEASPAETLYVGNSHSQDVVGAHRAGLQSAWVPHVRPHESTPADPDPEPTYWMDSPADLKTHL